MLTHFTRQGLLHKKRRVKNALNQLVLRPLNTFHYVDRGTYSRDFQRFMFFEQTETPFIPTVITGPRGTGKSTLVNTALKDVSPVVSVSISEKDGLITETLLAEEILHKLRVSFLPERVNCVMILFAATSELIKEETNPFCRMRSSLYGETN